MTQRGVSRKRKERLEQERANHIAGIERVRKEKKDEYLRKLREQREGRGAIETATEAYSSSFRSIPRPMLLEKKSTYQRMKKIAEGNKNELLVHHCEDMLEEINKWLKKRK